ncbi:MAG: class I SAM-dependent methyltransferase [Verrucomicrobiota bacterium]
MNPEFSTPMSDPVYDLYQNQAYPAMSHPSTDPAVTAVAAKLAGLDSPDPSSARILEIGCASGHNLLPLAVRWPESRVTGIDFSKSAIEEACEIARIAGLTNIEFIEADLQTFDPGNDVSYDFIICHGIYTWVPGAVRQALLDFCNARLSPQGSVMISYNTLPGWSLRKSIVDLVKQLSGKTSGGLSGSELEKILADLVMAAGNRTAYHRHFTQVLHDMLGQGGYFLTFDDFGPINEPCTFLDFIAHTSRSGLRYLGESRLSENYPGSLAPDALEILQPLANDPHLFQQTIDVLTNRTFRHSLLCRADAPIEPRSNAAMILKFAVRCPHVFERVPEGVRLLNHADEELARFEHPLSVAFFSALSQFSPETVPFHEVIVHMGEFLSEPFDFTRDLAPLVRLATDASRQGLISLRFAPVRFDASPPAMPNLGTLRLLAAEKGQPIIDAYHTPCLLDDERKRQIAILMDGSRTIDELTALAKTIAPDFNFPAWLRHLAARGMFTS